MRRNARSGFQTASLRLARLRRRSAEVIDRFGGDKYDLWEASLHWLAYLLLAKLEPVVYVLRLH
jgi:hypothetical protein